MDNDEGKKEFLKKFGTFFNEFKTEGFCLFYLLFVVRRFAILVIFLAFDNQALIMCLLSLFSLAVIVI